MSKRSDIGAKLTQLAEKVCARAQTHFSSFMGNLKILNPQKTVNMHLFQEIKKVLSDNVFMMVHVEKI